MVLSRAKSIFIFAKFKMATSVKELNVLNSAVSPRMSVTVQVPRKTWDLDWNE